MLTKFFNGFLLSCFFSPHARIVNRPAEFYERSVSSSSLDYV